MENSFCNFAYSSTFFTHPAVLMTTLVQDKRVKGNLHCEDFSPFTLLTLSPCCEVTKSENCRDPLLKINGPLGAVIVAASLL